MKKKRGRTALCSLNYGIRGQVTVFIIIALMIVVFGALIYMFYPQISSNARTDTKSPEAFIQTCMEDEIEDAVEILSSQGGSMDPEFYSLYLDDKVEYLCYTNEFYKTCVVQQPMLKQHIESEIESEIEQSALSRLQANEVVDPVLHDVEHRTMLLAQKVI